MKLKLEISPQLFAILMDATTGFSKEKLQLL